MEKNLDFEYRDILKNPPTPEEVNLLARRAGVTPLELINKKSAVFKKLGIGIEHLAQEEAARLISDNPRIMIRPLFADEERVYLGLEPHELEKKFLR